MGPKSNNLFHFTKSIDFLKGILLNGFLPRYCLEDARYLEIDYIAYPMTCFCDIPISRIADHTAFYGEYGIGLTKDWGLKNELAPIIYIAAAGVVSELATYLLNLNIKEPDGTNTKEQDDLNQHFLKLIPLIKPISGNMVVGGTIVEKEFYQENEWRYVPKVDFDLLFRNDFEAMRAQKNKEIEEQKITFLPSDVKYIFVKTDAEIPIMFDFIQNNLGMFPLNDIKILTSRIISLETITRDL